MIFTNPQKFLPQKPPQQMLPSKAVKSQWPAGAQENLLPDLAKVPPGKKHGRKDDGRSEE